VRFERTDSFKADYQRLAEEERALFREAVRLMNRAYAERGDSPLPAWPARLHIRHVVGAPGIYEVTWSFSGPDGRATYEYVTIDDEPAIRWRRIGGHAIFRDP
jgi:hypothetical protein